MTTPSLGIVACGHPNTAAAAEEILHDGGNAFDAIVAAHFSACVSEPVLASLGGGGYLLAHAQHQTPVIYDFFTQTPRQKPPADKTDFYAMVADFGTAQQEFHIGLGSAATPGSIRGMFSIHRDLCSQPMSRLLEPAIRQARAGIICNTFHSYIFDVIGCIFTATEEARATYAKGTHTLMKAGETLQQPALGDTLQALGEEGDALFYEGELAQRLATQCRDHGGCLTLEDLKHYQVIRRAPLELGYRQARIYTNAPPSSGGILIAFALGLLQPQTLAAMEWHSEEHLALLTHVMALTNKARIDAHLDSDDKSASLSDNDDLEGLEKLLQPELLHQYQQHIHKRSQCLRGTTHISVMDAKGNSASMTVSNGEGCGHMLPGSGIMLNNVLGEEDLNPRGFHRWQPNQRMTSMMAPTLIEILRDDKGTGASDEIETRVALGSGGSNRLRTAILQVISNLIDFDMTPQQAVDCSRIHLENTMLNIEQSDHTLPQSISDDFPQQKHWPERNLFFGGVHTVMQSAAGFSGAGDPRRGGVVVNVS